MPKGGHARSGPAPDPSALRRSRPGDGEWTALPSEGRAGDPPPWPLAGQSDREVELWVRMWSMPQAVQWERMAQVVEVALYVRNLAIVELPGSPVNLGTLLRQQADALGLTIPGMRSHRWRIAVNEVADKRDRQAAVTPAGSARLSARDRFQVVRDAPAS